jgi:hypothetical protein
MATNEFLQDYSGACSAAVADYVERATRFGAADLHIREAAASLQRFRVDLHLHLDVCSEFADVAGEPSHAANDLVVSGADEYQTVTGRQWQEEKERTATIRHLIESTGLRRYAAVVERTLVRSNPQRLLYTYGCGNCRAAGRVRCRNCHGGGHIPCSSCGARGTQLCFSCQGSGTVPVRDYSHGGARTERCLSCYGARVYTCTSCRGTGRRDCGSCGGGGMTTCDHCQGHSVITRVTQTNTYASPRFDATYSPDSPEYVERVLISTGLACVGQFGRVRLVATSVADSGHAGVAEYDAAVAFCELCVELNHRPSHWIFFGEPARMFDAGRSIQVLVEADSANMDALMQGRHRFAPSFPRRARGVVESFMQSEIHHAIVKADHEPLPPDATQFHGAVSEDYIEQSLERLHRVIRIALIWMRVRWISGLAASSLFITLILFPILDGETVFEMDAGADRFWLVPQNDAFAIALFTLPMTLTGSWIAILSSRKWLKKAGGADLLGWARRKTLVPGWRTAAAAALAGFLAVGGFYWTWPLWIDVQGRAYGVVPIVRPLRVVPPPPPYAAAPPRVPKRPAAKPAARHR